MCIGRERSAVDAENTKEDDSAPIGRQKSDVHQSDHVRAIGLLAEKAVSAIVVLVRIGQN